MTATPAAWLVRHIDHRSMGIVVAGVILFSDADRLLGLVGASRDVMELARVGIVVGTAGLMAGLRARRRDGAGCRRVERSGHCLTRRA